jgi:hypothetical protein
MIAFNGRARPEPVVLGDRPGEIDVGGVYDTIADVSS